MAVGITEKLTSAFSVKQQLFSVTYLMTPATRPARQLTTLCGHLFWSTWRVLQLLTAPNWTHWCLYNHRLRFTTSHVENSEIMPILCSEKKLKRYALRAKNRQRRITWNCCSTILNVLSVTL